MKACRLSLFLIAVVLMTLSVKVLAQPRADATAPASTVKLIFVHHSTGGNWLADPNTDQPYGGLGLELMHNNYYVSATNYGWGPYGIGDRTDIPNWPEWFTGTHRDTILSALYAETRQNALEYGAWSRLSTDPGGENEIIMFKSCFPNSDLYGNPDDEALATPNDYDYTVSNAKAVYNDILTYFETRQDKLFVVITAPPLIAVDTSTARAANARAFNNWLVDEWLNDYGYFNVAVFDYYNVLTATDNHHYWHENSVQHIVNTANNTSAYPSDPMYDSHPNTSGQTKATSEFVPLLNYYYNRWKSESPSQTKWVTIEGTVQYNGSSVCAMVLANGEYMFSCNENSGQYQLDVPLDPNGQVTLYCFCEGLAPYRQVLTPSATTTQDIDLSAATGDEGTMSLTAQTSAGVQNASWVTISGNATYGGEPLNIMVLANGEYQFSSSTDGSYSMEVPLDDNNQITLYGFCSGLAPYKTVVTPDLQL